MVNGQVERVLTAVLASVIVPAKDLTTIQPYPGSRSRDHFLQADDGRSGKIFADGVYYTPSIDYQRGSIFQKQPNCAPHIADVDRLEVCVENENILCHEKLFRVIIAREKKAGLPG